MDGFKEFLESSTVHGFTYISSTKPLILKLFWTSIVIGAFVTAGVFINSAFSRSNDVVKSNFMTNDFDNLYLISQLARIYR